MSAGQEFFIVAASGDSEKLLSNLKACPSFAQNRNHSELLKFNVPTGDDALQCGSFDSLIRLTDDLQRYDSQVEAICRRLERQMLEIDPKAEFKVTSQRQAFEFLDYLRNWQWDAAKYPKSRSITDNVALLMKAMGQFDEETRSKTAQFNDFKTQKTTIAPKDEAGVLAARDLVDVCTPDKVAEGDFVYSEYLDTVAFIIPKGADKELVECYATLLTGDENVVPGTAKNFPAMMDKEGNMLWRVVCFRSRVEELKKALRDKRWLVRDFKYSQEAYDHLQEQRKEVDEKVLTMTSAMKGLYSAAWSDAMVAWVHLKAMRVFVESVLRYGMPPKFATFLVSPQSGRNAVVRKALEGVLGAGDSAAQAGGDDEEEVYPYVSLTMMPFAMARDAK
jgi:V-type H+-transporting ATPase subunit C